MPDGRLDGDTLYLATTQVFSQKLHRDLPPTTLWGYNAQYPGPTFEARRGQPIGVRWMNNLPNHHVFPIDNTKHGVKGEPAVRTVVHLHGHKVLPESDGYPEAWFANNFERTGPFFELRTYRYPNDQAATQLWYHDPALGAAQQLRRALGRLSAARSRRGRPESSRRAVRDPAGDPGPVLQP
jgi:spore coat protein A, manganese oxidase